MKHGKGLGKSFRVPTPIVPPDEFVLGRTGNVLTAEREVISLHGDNDGLGQGEINAAFSEDRSQYVFIQFASTTEVSNPTFNVFVQNANEKIFPFVHRKELPALIGVDMMPGGFYGCPWIYDPWAPEPELNNEETYPTIVGCDPTDPPTYTTYKNRGFPLKTTVGYQNIIPGGSGDVNFRSPLYEGFWMSKGARLILHVVPGTHYLSVMDASKVGSVWTFQIRTDRTALGDIKDVLTGYVTKASDTSDYEFFKFSYASRLWGSRNYDKSGQKYVVLNPIYENSIITLNYGWKPNFDYPPDIIPGINMDILDTCLAPQYWDVDYMPTIDPYPPRTLTLPSNADPSNWTESEILGYHTFRLDHPTGDTIEIVEA